MLPQEYIIRTETPGDFRAVEELTREAFWNKYKPGCDEHYMLHLYRQRPDFVRELDLVLELGGRVIAHIMYSRANIVRDGGGTVPVMIFGPVSVLPEYQGMGYGGALIRRSLERASQLGCGAVAITGSPAYYSRFGFVSGSSIGVFYDGCSREDEAPFFMIKQLSDGYLDGVTGSFKEPDGYAVDADGLELYDKSFPPKKKMKLPGQLV